MMMKRLFFVLVMLGMAAISRAEMGLTLSNVTDSAANILWIDEVAGTCAVNYGLSACSGGTNTQVCSYTCPLAGDRRVEYDARGSRTVSQIHYVSLNDLKAATTYCYQTLVNNKPQASGTFTTTGALIPSGSYLAYGRVYAGHKPAVGAVVCLWLEDGDGKDSQGKSAAASCLTDENGYWFYDLINLRTSDNKGPFEFSKTGDGLYLDVYAEDGAVLKTRMDTGSCMPARDLYLK